MPTSYTSLLGLALPVTGELSGVWGDTVNDYITNYLDGAVAGTQTISGSQTAVTLSKTTGSALTQAGSGATGSSQYSIINCTGNPASLLTITAPAASKPYIVINATSTSQQVKLVGAGPTTGVTLASGEKAVIAWNGSDFAKIASTVVTPAGSTTQVQYNNAGALAGSANLTFDGTNFATTGRATANDFVASGSAYYTTVGGTTYGSLIATAGTLTLNANNGTGLIFSVASSEGMRLTSTGLGLGTTSLSSISGTVRTLSIGGTNATTSGGIAYQTNGTVKGYHYIDSDNMVHQSISGGQLFFASNTERMRLDSSGNLGIGTSTPNTAGYGGAVLGIYGGSNAGGNIWLTSDTTAAGNRAGRIGFGTEGNSTNKEIARVWSLAAGSTAGNLGGDLLFSTKPDGGALAERARITAEGFTRPVAYADTVSALGNTGTATTIDCRNANVFTATLTGNCTFTLSNPIATGSSSFTLILTNDGTAGRTVAWSGGSFVFPGGAASLSRTTTANAVDVWVFFTPNGGTTWYGNIAMKDMKA